MCSLVRMFLCARLRIEYILFHSGFIGPVCRKWVRSKRFLRGSSRSGISIPMQLQLAVCDMAVLGSHCPAVAVAPLVGSVTLLIALRMHGQVLP